MDAVRKLNCEQLCLFTKVEKPTFGSWHLAGALKCENGFYHGHKISEIELCGLCTGICVISNAILIKTVLPEVPITIDAACCACVTPESHENALKAMELLQINIANWKESQDD